MNLSRKKRDEFKEFQSIWNSEQQILQKFFPMTSNLYCLWRYHRNAFKKGSRCRMDTKGVLFLAKCFLSWIPLHSASNYLEILDNPHHIVEIYVTQYISRHAYYCLDWWTLSERHIQAQNCWKWYIYTEEYIYRRSE